MQIIPAPIFVCWERGDRLWWVRNSISIWRNSFMYISLHPVQGPLSPKGRRQNEHFISFQMRHLINKMTLFLNMPMRWKGFEQNPETGNSSAENREEKSIYFETNRGVPRLFTSTSTPRPGSAETEPIPFLERG